jgi:hypothetical protein
MISPSFFMLYRSRAIRSIVTPSSFLSRPTCSFRCASSTAIVASISFRSEISELSAIWRQIPLFAKSSVMQSTTSTELRSKSFGLRRIFRMRFLRALGWAAADWAMIRAVWLRAKNGLVSHTTSTNSAAKEHKEHNEYIALPRIVREFEGAKCIIT